MFRSTRCTHHNACFFWDSRSTCPWNLIEVLKSHRLVVLLFGVINSWGGAAAPRLEYPFNLRNRLRSEPSAHTIQGRCAGVFRASTHPNLTQSRSLLALMPRACARSGSHHSFGPSRLDLDCPLVSPQRANKHRTRCAVKAPCSLGGHKPAVASLVPAKPTACSRVTRRASSDPACSYWNTCLGLTKVMGIRGPPLRSFGELPLSIDKDDLALHRANAPSGGYLT
jgi:hypothetical protein